MQNAHVQKNSSQMAKKFQKNKFCNPGTTRTIIWWNFPTFSAIFFNPNTLSSWRQRKELPQRGGHIEFIERSTVTRRDALFQRRTYARLSGWNHRATRILIGELISYRTPPGIRMSAYFTVCEERADVVCHQHRPCWRHVHRYSRGAVSKSLIYIKMLTGWRPVIWCGYVCRWSVIGRGE